jgi:hypothetical protein
MKNLQLHFGQWLVVLAATASSCGQTAPTSSRKGQSKTSPEPPPTNSGGGSGDASSKPPDSNSAATLPTDPTPAASVQKWDLIPNHKLRDPSNAVVIGKKFLVLGGC